MKLVANDIATGSKETLKMRSVDMSDVKNRRLLRLDGAVGFIGGSH